MTQDNTPSADLVGRAIDALKAAEQFITNGVDYGYIQMPDADTPDPAHDTLPKIEAALSALTEAAEASERYIEALCRIAGKNDLSEVPEHDLEFATRQALYECIAREALDPEVGDDQ